MRRYALLYALLMSSSILAGQTNDKSIVRVSTKLFRDYAATLRSVKDKTTAQSAASKLDGYYGEVSRFKNRSRSLPQKVRRELLGMDSPFVKEMMSAFAEIRRSASLS